VHTIVSNNKPVKTTAINTNPPKPATKYGPDKYGYGVMDLKNNIPIIPPPPFVCEESIQILLNDLLI